MRRRILVVLFAVFLVAGATAAIVLLVLERDGRDRRGVVTGTVPAGAVAPTTTTLAPTTTTVDRRGSGQPVTFAFAGDIHFEGVLRGKLAANPAGVLAPIAPVLSSADLTIANLET